METILSNIEYTFKITRLKSNKFIQKRGYDKAN